MGNDQVFNFFTAAYKKSKPYEALWDGSPDHAEPARILIRILENLSHSELTRGS